MICIGSAAVSGMLSTAQPVVMIGAVSRCWLTVDCTGKAEPVCITGKERFSAILACSWAVGRRFVSFGACHVKAARQACQNGRT
jgi:hypothetical protein